MYFTLGAYCSISIGRSPGYDYRLFSSFGFRVLHNFRFQLVRVFGFHSTLQGPSACCKVSNKEKGKVLDLTRNFVFCVIFKRSKKI